MNCMIMLYLLFFTHTAIFRRIWSQTLFYCNKPGSKVAMERMYRPHYLYCPEYQYLRATTITTDYVTLS